MYIETSITSMLGISMTFSKRMKLLNVLHVLHTIYYMPAIDSTGCNEAYLSVRYLIGRLHINYSGKE